MHFLKFITKFYFLIKKSHGKVMEAFSLKQDKNGKALGLSFRVIVIWIEIMTFFVYLSDK